MGRCKTLERRLGSDGDTLKYDSQESVQRAPESPSYIFKADIVKDGDISIVIPGVYSQVPGRNESCSLGEILRIFDLAWRRFCEAGLAKCCAERRNVYT